MRSAVLPVLAIVITLFGPVTPVAAQSSLSLDDFDFAPSSEDAAPSFDRCGRPVTMRQPTPGGTFDSETIFDMDDVQNLGNIEPKSNASNPACGDLMAAPLSGAVRSGGPDLSFSFAPGSSDPARGLLRHFDAIETLRAQVRSGQRYLLLGYGGQTGTAEAQQDLAAQRLTQLTQVLVDLGVLPPAQIIALIRPTPPLSAFDWDVVSVFRMATGAR
ncbi:hypothetical protein ACS3QZ_09255 [Shimia sp. W99]